MFKQYTDFAKHISGNWTNQLGSNVEMQALNGQISGAYKTKVGNATVTHPLQGTYSEQKDGCLVAWTVAWTKLKDPSKPQSLCSWNGHLVPSQNQTKIVTTWLLNSWEPQELWKATTINKDTFTKSE